MHEPLTSNVTDTALLFEGGGMRAAYTSAVVAELLRERIHVDFVAGISAGSSNAANYLSRDAVRARAAFVDFAAVFLADVAADLVAVLVRAAAFFVVYAIAIVLTRPYLGRRQDRRGDNSVIPPALVVFAATLVVLAFASSGWMLLVAGAMLGCSFGAIITAAQAAAVKVAPISRVGLTTATFFLCMDVGATVGPAALGAVVPALGYRGMYLCAAGVLLVSVVYYWLVHGRGAGRTPSPPTGQIPLP